MSQIQCYQQQLGLENSSFSEVKHEDAIVAIVYRVIQPNGKSLILKVCPRNQDFLREAYFLEHFAGILPVPRIVKLIPPQAEVAGAILMEFLPGALLKTSDLTDRLAFELGLWLARIHLSRAVGYGDLTQPENLKSDPRSNFTLMFEEGLAECKDHLPKTLLNRIHRYYDTHVDLLALADGPCLIHRDFRPGNIIVHDGKISGIIDWASGRASFAQEDFCPLEHGEWSFTPRLRESFFAGYASIRPVPAYQSMMPLLRLGRAVAVVGYTVKQGSWETSSASLYQRNRHVLETFATA